MSRILDQTQISVSTSDSILGFTTAGGGSLAVWDRYLTIDGVRAYHLGNVCDTCAFFFERLEGANRSVSPTHVATTLQAGLRSLDPAFVATVGHILPAGDYWALLLEVTPHLVAPGTEQDYFTKEQIALWGLDGFWGLPHHPKTEYYRTPARFPRPDAQLIEFIVPMFPHTWLDQDRVAYFHDVLLAGTRPTALALSILDVKQPATWTDEVVVTEHWCLAHYVLDGHHKLYAAAAVQQPITLLAFLAVREGVATDMNIQRVVDTLVSGGGHGEADGVPPPHVP